MKNGFSLQTKCWYSVRARMDVTPTRRANGRDGIHREKLNSWIMVEKKLTTLYSIFNFSFNFAVCIPSDSSVRKVQMWRRFATRVVTRSRKAVVEVTRDEFPTFPRWRHRKRFSWSKPWHALGQSLEWLPWSITLPSRFEAVSLRWFEEIKL